MRSLFSIAIIFVLNGSFSQNDYPAGTRYVKKTVATMYNGTEVTGRKTVYVYYDSEKNVIKNENTLNTSLNENTSMNIINQTDREYKSAEINEAGDTISMIVRLYDDHGNETHYYQIRNRDTLNAQTRTYDERGNCLQLFSSSHYSQKIYLDMEWKYDEHNNVIYTTDIDDFDGTVTETKYENEYDAMGKLSKVTAFTKENETYKLKYVAVYNGYKVRTDTYYELFGVNYGIQIKLVVGGYTLEEFFENGTLKSLEVYDAEANKTCSVYVTNFEVK